MQVSGPMPMEGITLPLAPPTYLASMNDLVELRQVTVPSGVLFVPGAGTISGASAAVGHRLHLWPQEASNES